MNNVATRHHEFLTTATSPEMLQAPKMGWLNFSSVIVASGISWRGQA
jgi:hypothetical protein